jgi:uncharacterized protein YerC
MFANANRDSNATIARVKRQKIQLADAKEGMKLLINIVRPLLDQYDVTHIVSGHDKPTLYINMRKLDSFKTGRITKVLQVLEAFGESEGTDEWASAVNRDYKYGMDKYDVVLCAYVREDSATCRKIAVGSETQVVVKYEIQCD